jgi:hypothetical protein
MVPSLSGFACERNRLLDQLPLIVHEGHRYSSGRKVQTQRPNVQSLSCKAASCRPGRGLQQLGAVGPATPWECSDGRRPCQPPSSGWPARGTSRDRTHASNSSRLRLQVAPPLPPGGPPRARRSQPRAALHSPSDAPGRRGPDSRRAPPVRLGRPEDSPAAPTARSEARLAGAEHDLRHPRPPRPRPAPPSTRARGGHGETRSRVIGSPVSPSPEAW